MLSNRTKKYAEKLNYQGHRHPVIKLMLLVLSLLSDFRERKETDKDPGRFLSTLGFPEDDRRRLTSNTAAAYFGQGYFRKEDAPEVLRLIGFTKKSAEAFGEYNIILEIFSLKSSRKDQEPLSVEEIVRDLRFSKEGQVVLRQMHRLFEGRMTTLYYRYFEER
jgi:hypothetical protein